MNIKRLIFILLIFCVIFLTYLGYRLYIPFKQTEYLKNKWGVERVCEEFPNSPFTTENWIGMPLDDEIRYTDGAHNIVPYDLNKDGKMELIANSYRSDMLMFYQYSSDPHLVSNWKRYIIDPKVGGSDPRPKGSFLEIIKSSIKRILLGEIVGGAHYTAIADINNDGREDLVVAGDEKNCDVIWYEAPEEITDVSKWIKHCVYKNDSHRTYHLETGDIDGDGYRDIVFTTKTDNSLAWLKNTGLSNNWPVIWIDTRCIRCFNSRIADIDKDGKMDVIASEDDSENGGIIHLYTFMNDPTITNEWIDRKLTTFPNGEGVSVLEIADIDMDGDLDIVVANHQGNIYILENPYPDGLLQSWNRYKITDSSAVHKRDFREISIGDIDNDNDLDIAVADQGENKVMWFENDGRTLCDEWKKHVIDASDEYLDWCHSVELRDIDGDGDLDIAVAAAASNVFLWYSNEINKSDCAHGN